MHDSARGAARLFVDERLFFNLGAAMFAYIYGELAAIGADMVAASQTLAFNGAGNAFFWSDFSFDQTIKLPRQARNEHT